MTHGGGGRGGGLTRRGPVSASGIPSEVDGPSLPPVISPAGDVVPQRTTPRTRSDTGPFRAPSSSVGVTLAPMSDSPATTPARIHADRGAGTVDIDWADGHRTTYTAPALRWMCPCAFCRGEAGMPGWLDSKPTLTDTQTRITGLALVGHYAVQPTWADGHGTGFYAFTRLREQCPCPECTARRGGVAGAARAHAGHGGTAT